MPCGGAQPACRCPEVLNHGSSSSIRRQKRSNSMLKEVGRGEHSVPIGEQRQCELPTRALSVQEHGGRYGRRLSTRKDSRADVRRAALACARKTRRNQSTTKLAVGERLNAVAHAQPKATDTAQIVATAC
eukprot:1575082-Pleurochrysis_carterae.AAC.1